MICLFQAASLAGENGDLCGPAVGLVGRVGDDVELGVGYDLRPGVGPPRDVHPQVVHKVGRHAQPEDGVGQLEGKVGRLGQLGPGRLEGVKGFRPWTLQNGQSSFMLSFENDSLGNLIRIFPPFCPYIII